MLLFSSLFSVLFFLKYNVSKNSRQFLVSILFSSTILLIPFVIFFSLLVSLGGKVNPGSNRKPNGLYCPILKEKVKNRLCKQWGIYYPSIAARKRHRQDACGLEVLGNKVIDEGEEISQEEEENS